MSNFTVNDVVYTIYSASSVFVGANSSYSGSSNVVIPNVVTNNLGDSYEVVGIEAQSFRDNSIINIVSFPPLITSFPDGCFYNCANLRTLTFTTSSIYTIDSYAFGLSPNITTITFTTTTLPNLGPEDPFNILPNSTVYYQYGTPTANLNTFKSYGYFGTYEVQNAPPIICFKEGNKILTDKGYIKVENLKKGDLVKTIKNGFKRIDMIGKKDIIHYASQERIQDQLYKCSKENYPELSESLVITGCHSILVDKFISEEQKQKAIEINSGRLCVTDGKYRLPVCVDERASVYEEPGNYTIYHFALENDDYYMNYGIYANGLLVETCSKRYLKELSGMKLI